MVDCGRIQAPRGREYVVDLVEYVAGLSIAVAYPTSCVGNLDFPKARVSTVNSLATSYAPTFLFITHYLTLSGKGDSSSTIRATSSVSWHSHCLRVLTFRLYNCSFSIYPLTLRIRTGTVQGA